LQDLNAYYVNEEFMSEEEIKDTLPLETLNISIERFNELNDKLDNILEKYTNTHQ